VASHVCSKCSDSQHATKTYREDARGASPTTYNGYTGYERKTTNSLTDPTVLGSYGCVPITQDVTGSSNVIVITSPVKRRFCGISR
jgi:hypothetical protein